MSSVVVQPLFHLAQYPSQENEDSGLVICNLKAFSAPVEVKKSKRQSTGKGNISCNHILKNKSEYTHRVIMGCVSKLFSIHNHCKTSPSYLNSNTLTYNCAKKKKKKGFLRIEKRASEKLVEVPSKQPRINQHANAVLIYSRAMHLDPPAVTHIPSGVAAVCSIVVILTDTNNWLLNLSSAKNGECYILFLSFGFGHFSLHSVQGS